MRIPIQRPTVRGTVKAPLRIHVVGVSVPNPYLEEFNQPRRGLRYYTARPELVAKYSWAVPNQEAIEALVALSPIVEIGAGTGYWASLVAAAGGQIVAFDAAPPGAKGKENQWHPEPYQWFDVKVGGPKTAAKYPDHTLFLCWPPYNDSFAADTLKAYMQAGGQRLVVVGEGQWGCTADDEFFELLGQHWKDERFIDIPQWDGMHDGMNIYRRLVAQPIHPVSGRPKTKIVSGRGPRKDTVGASDLWEIVKAAQALPFKEGGPINYYSELPNSAQYLLTEKDTQTAHQLYEKAVNLAMSQDIPLSSVRVEMSAFRHRDKLGRIVMFLRFDGRSWSAAFGPSLPATMGFKPNESGGQSYLEIGAEDLSSKQLKYLEATKLRGKPVSRILVATASGDSFNWKEEQMSLLRDGKKEIWWMRALPGRIKT